jgi:hypothetical protein
MLSVAGFLASFVRAWRRDSPARIPTLEICPTTITSQHHHRIRIRSRSPHTVRIAVNLTDLTPGIGHPLPSRLKILGSVAPYREAELPGNGEAIVEVLAHSPMAPTMRFGIAEEFAVDGPVQSYGMVVCAFPVSSEGGVAVRRRFRVLLASDNTATLAGDGEPLPPVV